MTKEEQQIVDFIGTHVRYDRDGTMIWGVQPNGEHQLVLDVRGWGAIQNLPQFKNNELEAGNFQDAVGQFFVDAINEKLKTLTP